MVKIPPANAGDTASTRGSGLSSHSPQSDNLHRAHSVPALTPGDKQDPASAKHEEEVSSPRSGGEITLGRLHGGGVFKLNLGRCVCQTDWMRQGLEEVKKLEQRAARPTGCGSLWGGSE